MVAGGCWWLLVAVGGCGGCWRLRMTADCCRGLLTVAGGCCRFCQALVIVCADEHGLGCSCSSGCGCDFCC